MTDNKVIYSMIGVGKTVPPNRTILRDIYLSYFYGAKIGVLGLNGSGKSSLLKIMAGVDKEYLGETVLAPGYTVGYLEQEPLIDETRTVREVVEERLLLQIADGVAGGQDGLAQVLLVDPGHNLQQGAFAGAVEAQHADLRAVEIGQIDIAQDGAIGWNGFAHADHGIDYFVVSHSLMLLSGQACRSARWSSRISSICICSTGWVNIPTAFCGAGFLTGFPTAG